MNELFGKEFQDEMMHAFSVEVATTAANTGALYPPGAQVPMNFKDVLRVLSSPAYTSMIAEGNSNYLCKHLIEWIHCKCSESGDLKWLNQAMDKYMARKNVLVVWGDPRAHGSRLHNVYRYAKKSRLTVI